MACVIRICTSADLPAVRALLAETWHATYDHLLGPDKVREITASWHSIERLAAQVDPPGTLFLVATIDQLIVATAFAHETRHGPVEIGRLYVLPHHQNEGIGGALLTELVAGFPAATSFHLDVEPRNAGAIRFYQRHGFGIVDAGGDSCCGAGLAHLRMSRRGR